MPEPRGPWDRGPDEPPAAAHKPFQLGLWVSLIVGAIAGVWALTRLFPGAVSSRDDWSNVVYGLGLVAVVSAGLLRRGRVSLGQSARYVVIWLGVLVALAVGYSYRGELGALALRVRSDFAPGYAAVAAPHQMVVSQDDQGQFVVIGQVDGQTVRFVVDTGASDIVLSPADARRLGVDVDRLAYPAVNETANGLGRSAPFRARSLVIGDLRLSDVAMSINAKPMTASLLGMAFLRRLQSFQVKDQRLYMTWRG